MEQPSRRRGRPGVDDPEPLSDATLLDAALEAFADHGFEGTSVRELARRLGVSHNLIPQRYGSKERLWYAAVDHGFGAVAVDIVGVLGDGPYDDVVRLRMMIVRFIEANAARPALLRIINQEAVAPSRRFDYIFDSYIEPVRVAGGALLDELKAKGRVRTSSAMLLYFLMTYGAGGPLVLPALAERFGEPVDSADPGAVRRHAEHVVDVLFDGLEVTEEIIDT